MITRKRGILNEERDIDNNFLTFLEEIEGSIEQDTEPVQEEKGIEQEFLSLLKKGLSVGESIDSLIDEHGYGMDQVGEAWMNLVKKGLVDKDMEESVTGIGGRGTELPEEDEECE